MAVRLGGGGGPCGEEVKDETKGECSMKRAWWRARWGQAGKTGESCTGESQRPVSCEWKGLIIKVRIYQAPPAGWCHVRSLVEGTNQPQSLPSSSLCLVQSHHLFLEVGNLFQPVCLSPLMPEGYAISLSLDGDPNLPCSSPRRPLLTCFPPSPFLSPPCTPATLADWTLLTHLVSLTQDHFFIS